MKRLQNILTNSSDLQAINIDIKKFRLNFRFSFFLPKIFLILLSFNLEATNQEKEDKAKPANELYQNLNTYFGVAFKLDDTGYKYHYPNILNISLEEIQHCLGKAIIDGMENPTCKGWLEEHLDFLSQSESDTLFVLADIQAREGIHHKEQVLEHIGKIKDENLQKAAEQLAQAAFTQWFIGDKRIAVLVGLFNDLGSLLVDTSKSSWHIFHHLVEIAKCSYREEKLQARLHSGIRPRSHYHVWQYREGIEPKRTLEYREYLQAQEEHPDSLLEKEGFVFIY